MIAPVFPLLATGFLLGWSVAWPPGPINSEIARRCLAGGFWAGFTVVLGACSADAFWAALVSLGIGAIFAAPAVRTLLGITSVVLLLALAALFLRGAWRALAGREQAAESPFRFATGRAGFLLGASMALASPWNVAFWIAAVGRPELAGNGAYALLLMAAAVLSGALAWGLVWSGSVVLLRRRAGSKNSARWGTFGVELATALLMIYFALESAVRIF
ncbi:MAG TPA: LysE family transporter [Roseiarcus sp.]|nr:LysE family transporter [Roseiarcus sp.]